MRLQRDAIGKQFPQPGRCSDGETQFLGASGAHFRRIQAHDPHTLSAALDRVAINHSAGFGAYRATLPNQRRRQSEAGQRRKPNRASAGSRAMAMGAQRMPASLEN